MFHIILYEPEIPPNTGNIMRLCANTGCLLHLVHPLGFSLDEKRLRRAGLDYMDQRWVREHPDLVSCLESLPGSRVFACSTKGTVAYTDPEYRENDAFLFGPETRGLPDEVLHNYEHGKILRVPMLPDSRSMNLSNTVAVVLYEAWRQNKFLGSSS